MQLLSLELENYRNYSTAKIHFNSKRNVLSGKNAQGKSNLLEAIYFLCISRSFRSRAEKDILNFNEDFFRLKGEFLSDNNINSKIVLQFTKNEGKKFSVNGKLINRLSDHIGRFPIVISSPEEYNLTLGPPAERRRFIDILLSQLSKKYIHNLKDYFHILKQRNKILSDHSVFNKKMIEPWNEALINTGSQITWDRKLFSDNLDKYIANIYSELNQSNERLNFKYDSVVGGIGIDEIRNRFQQELSQAEEDEIRRRITTVGPHRDDLVFLINDKDLRKFGSRGQHKTVLIALMLAEYHLIKEKRRETPIILIDDLFSEIDDVREKRILNHLENLGQIVFTTTYDIHALRKREILIKDTIYFNVENGIIEKIDETF